MSPNELINLSTTTEYLDFFCGSSSSSRPRLKESLTLYFLDLVLPPVEGTADVTGEGIKNQEFKGLIFFGGLKISILLS